MNDIIDPNTRSAIIPIPLATSKYHMIKIDKDVRICNGICILDDFIMMIDVRIEKLAYSTIKQEPYIRWHQYASFDGIVGGRQCAGYAHKINQITIKKSAVNSIVSFDSVEECPDWVLRDEKDAIEIANNEQAKDNANCKKHNRETYKKIKEEYIIYKATCMVSEEYDNLPTKRFLWVKMPKVNKDKFIKENRDKYLDKIDMEYLYNRVKAEGFELKDLED